MSAPRTVRFLETIGTGGFGSVYLAEVHARGGFVQRLAVKVLSAELAASSDVAARHRDEARLLALLNHDNIVKVVDMVEIDGRPALLMEVVDGVDCGALLRHAPLPARAAIEVGQAVASALRFASETPEPGTGRPLAVVHRDIKPANILISRHGGVKVLDFGIARGDFDREGRTESVQFGTARYMAPEQFISNESTDKVDIYALGVTLLELLAGRQLARAPLQPEAFASHVRAALDAVLARWSPAPRAAAAGLLRGMCSWEPADRPKASEVHAVCLGLAEQLPGPGLARYAPEVVPALVEARRAKHQSSPRPSDATVQPAPSRPREARLPTRPDLTLPTPRPTLLDAQAVPGAPGLLGGDPRALTGPIQPVARRSAAEPAVIDDTAALGRALAAPPAQATRTPSAPPQTDAPTHSTAALPRPAPVETPTTDTLDPPAAPAPPPLRAARASPAPPTPARQPSPRVHPPTVYAELAAADTSAPQRGPTLLAPVGPAPTAQPAPRARVPHALIGAAVVSFAAAAAFALRPRTGETIAHAGASAEGGGLEATAERAAEPTNTAPSAHSAPPEEAAQPALEPSPGPDTAPATTAARRPPRAPASPTPAPTPAAQAPVEEPQPAEAPPPPAPGPAAEAGPVTVPVRFTSTPPGALVAVDDAGIGAAPTSALPLTPGRHRVRMVLDGQACSGDVKISALGAATVHCDLPTGTLSRGR